MNELVDYFKNSGMKLGVFYPTHHLIAVFRHPADAQFAVHQIWNAGFATSDAIAADGKDVLEFDKEETSLAVRCPTDELKNAAWSIIEPEKPLDAVCGSRGGVPRVARTGKQVVKGGVGRSGAL
jgi:hypothetical protein